MQLKMLYIIFILSAFVFANTEQLHTDLTTHFSTGSLNIERNLVIKPVERVSSSTGAVASRYESIITIKIKNLAKEAKTDFVIQEDLTYLPQDVKPSYNIQPKIEDAFSALWKKNILEAGEEYEIIMRLPGMVSADEMKSLPIPGIEYNMPKAVLQAPEFTEKDGNIMLELADSYGNGISNAFIRIGYPDGESKLVATDREGKVGIIAEQIGFYTFSVPDYDVGGVEKTQTVKEIIEFNGEKEEEVEEKEEGGDVLGPLASILPILLGLAIALVIAFSIYRYFSSPVDEEEKPLPPAPATKPATKDADERVEEIEYMQGEQPIAPPLMPDMAEIREEEGQASEDVSAISQDMIARRREKREEEVLEMAEEEERAESGEEVSGKEEAGEMEWEGKEEEMPQPEIKEEQIDDDAIKKTIAELEQLREQLKEGKKDEIEELQEEAQEDMPIEQEYEFKAPVEEEETEKQMQGIMKEVQEQSRKELIDEDIGKLLKETEKDVKGAGRKGRARKGPSVLPMKEKAPFKKGEKVKKSGKLKKLKKAKPRKPAKKKGRKKRNK
ncbi:MAG: hypothetical protein ABIH83_04565 [Candidatus Micrarchaeota archaeon]